MDFSGKTILITGGTGSFGKACTRHLLDAVDPHAVRIFSRDELKQTEMEAASKDERLRFLIGDVRDRERLERCLGRAGLRGKALWVRLSEDPPAGSEALDEALQEWAAGDAEVGLPEQAVVAQHFQRHPLARLGQFNVLIRRIGDQPQVGQPLDHVGGGGGRDVQIIRPRGVVYLHPLRLQHVDRLQVIIVGRCKRLRRQRRLGISHG